MKSKELFEEKIELEDEITDDMISDMDFSDMDFSEYEEFGTVFEPNHVQIDDNVVVDLIQNGMVIKTKTWGDMIAFIEENYHLMNGSYIISHQGSQLHNFVISRQ